MLINPFTIITALFSWYRAKQEMQLKWYQFAWSIIKDVLGLAARNIKITVFIITLTIAYIYVTGLRSDIKARDNIIASMKHDIVKRKEAERIAKTAAHEHAAVSAMLSRSKADDDIKAIIVSGKSHISQEARNNETINNLNHRLDSYRQRMLLDIQRQSDIEYQVAKIREASADCDATILGQLQQENEKLIRDFEVCKEAGAIAASDYNYCFGYAEGIYEACSGDKFMYAE